MTNMKYYCIVSTSGVGGVWSVVKESILWLKDIYDTHLIIYTRCGELEKHVIDFLEFNNVKYSLIDIPTTNGFLFDFYKFLKIGELKKIIDNDSPVIIHSQDSYISGCVLFPFRKSNSKLFCTFHGTLFPCKSIKSYIQYFINRYIRVGLIKYSNATLISCDPYSINKISKYFKNRKIHLAVNGIAHNGFKHVRNNEKKLSIGFMSRFHPLKGWSILAKAVEELQNEGYNILLYFAGTGECEYEIKKLCQQNEKFIFLGNKDNLNVEVFPLIDVHILPTEYPEGLPMIILETMAAQIPTITTDIGSCAFAVKDKVNGYVIKPSIDELKDRIKKIYYDRALYDNMQKHCFEIWSKNFSSKAMVDAYNDIFCENE